MLGSAKGKGSPVEHGKRAICSSYAIWPRCATAVSAPVAQRAGVKSGVCLPITEDGKVVGTMDFFSMQTLDLSQERMDALRSVAGLVSSRLLGMKTSENATMAAADAQAVTEVIQKMAACQTVDAALRAALDTVRDAFGWAYGSYWALDKAENVLKFAVESGSVNEEFRRVTADARFREGEGLSGRTWKARDLFFVRDLAEMRDCCRAPVAQRAGVKSGVCLPITEDGKVVGTMDFFSMQTLDLSQERMDALRSVAGLVSSRLLGMKTSENAVKAAEDAKAVTQIVEKIADCPTVEDVARTAPDTVRQLFGWAYGSYWRLDPKENVLKFQVESGSVNDEFRRVTVDARFREGEGLSGRAWKARDLVFVRDLGEMHDCCRAPVAQRAGVKSGVCFPIVVDGKVAGTMDFFTKETLELSDDRKEALRGVAG